MAAAPRNTSLKSTSSTSKSVVKQRYNEPPSVEQAEIVVCAGAENYGAPGRIISGGRGASVVRPTVGGSSTRWLTLPEARAEFAI